MLQRSRYPRPYVEEMRQALALRPHRIGHGIIAAIRLLEEVLEARVVLEVCPTSNVRTGAVRDEAQMAEIIYELHTAAVPWSSPPTAPR